DCWTPPPGGLGADQIAVKLRLKLNEDGTLVGYPTVANSGSSPFFQAAADRAVRAVFQCQPYELPQAKYALWRDMILNFDPSEMYRNGFTTDSQTMAPFIPHLVRSGLALALIALALVAGSGQANAVVELNITQGKIQPLPIAIPGFTDDGSIDPQEARAISDVVAADLSSSGLFNPIDQAA